MPGRRAAASLCTAATAALVLAPLTPAAADHVDVQPIDIACPEGAFDAPPYTDVNPANTFAREIGCVSEYDIARGRTTTTFEPAGLVLRRQMALFVYRLGLEAGVDFDTTADPGFTDDDELAGEARDAVWGLANAGVVRGLTADTYGPNGTVSREQMASFLARLAGEIGLDDRFVADADYFDDDEDSVHEANIDAIASEGITVGRGADRLYAPREPVTRQQMAGFLARTLNVVVEERGPLEPPEETLDVTPLDAATLVAQPNPDTATSDDRTFTVEGLLPGVDYRVVLYAAEFVTRGTDGEPVFVVDETIDQQADGAFVAASGSPRARITSVDGEAAEPDFDGAEGEVAAPDNGVITVVVDGAAPESVFLVVHRNGGPGRTLEQGGTNLRLEVDATGAPLEPVGVGGVTTYTAS